MLSQTAPVTPRHRSSLQNRAQIEFMRGLVWVGVGCHQGRIIFTQYHAG